MEEESLTLTKSSLKDLYCLYYKGNLIALVILTKYGVALRIDKESVGYIDIR